MSVSNLIPDTDLHIDTVNPRGQGGQHVLSVGAVRVTHLPTGIVAQVECRSQHRSRTVAIQMIEAALTSPDFR